MWRSALMCIAYELLRAQCAIACAQQCSPRLCVALQVTENQCGRQDSRGQGDECVQKDIERARPPTSACCIAT